MAVAFSVCIPADGVETLRPVLEHLRRQTIASSIELVIATPDEAGVRAALSNESGIAAVRVVGVATLAPLGNARAAAVHAATAPCVFMGETHSFADPQWAERLLARHEEGWAVVVPGIANANPRSMLSWAALLLDYGAWLRDLPSGEVQYWPLNNASYKRTVLLECEDLPRGLAFGDQLLLAIRGRGHRIYFEPQAGLAHLNMTHLPSWFDERWLGGILVARYRSSDWTSAKRLFYLFASPLIPLVLFSRVAGSAFSTIRVKGLPLATLPMMFLGSLVHGLGEAAGYAGIGSLDRAEAKMTEYEINKMRYARRVP